MEPTLTLAARLRLAAPGAPLQELDDGDCHVGTARRLHALDTGRGVDLDHQRPAAGAHHVDAAHVEAKRLGRAQRRLALLLGEGDRLGFAAAMPAS